jgi:uncharacterized protein YdaU (DUF1376 family)
MTAYEVLGVAPTATFEESTRAYRRLCFEYHPDRNGNSPESHAWFLVVNDAYAWVKQAEEDRLALVAQAASVTRFVERAVATFLDARQRKRVHDAEETHRAAVAQAAAAHAAAVAAWRRQKRNAKRKQKRRRQLAEEVEALAVAVGRIQSRSRSL